ncbi:hypothetical protein [Nocardioides panacisoli]|uniref:Uncharacterized protein n=1 Tax=Nocardioides panacisoli TaxID=627624 RepID=A0ABP7HQ23_9ACTN
MNRPPGQVPPGLVDVWLLLAALVVCVPAGFRLAEGMVSLTDLLTRYLVVAVGCVALAAAVRWVWPILSGEAPPAPTRALPATPAPAASAREEADPVDDEPATTLLTAFGDESLDLRPTEQQQV